MAVEEQDRIGQAKWFDRMRGKRRGIGPTGESEVRADLYTAVGADAERRVGQDKCAQEMLYEHRRIVFGILRQLESTGVTWRDARGYLLQRMDDDLNAWHSARS